MSEQKNSGDGDSGWKPPFSDPEFARKAGRKGGKASGRARRGGINPEELGDLETHADAKRWLGIIGRAAAGADLSNKNAHAAIRAVEVWLKAAAEEMTAEVVEDVKAELERLKKELAEREPWK